MRPPELREGLLCLTSDPEHLVGVLVRREGLRFSLAMLLLDDQAALASSPKGLETLEQALHLPVRVLPGSAGSLLGLHTVLANRRGEVLDLSGGRKLPSIPP